MQNKLFSFLFKKKKSFYRHEEYVRPPRYMQLSGSLYWHHMGEALASTQITQRSTAPLSDLGCSSDRGFNHTEGKVRALWCPTGVPPLTLIPFSKHISDRVVGFSIHYGSCVQLGLHTGEGKNSISAKTMLLKQAALFHSESVQSILSFLIWAWFPQTHC